MSTIQRLQCNYKENEGKIKEFTTTLVPITIGSIRENKLAVMPVFKESLQICQAGAMFCRYSDLSHFCKHSIFK